MPDDTSRWSTAQVLALAPDPSARRAGQSLGTAGPWRDTGCSPEGAAVWGLCQGSGKNPYQTCVDLTEPAYRCTCPSRKFPCKHALGLLLLWSAGGVERGGAAGLGGRVERVPVGAQGQGRRSVPRQRATRTPDRGRSSRAARRIRRVEAGWPSLSGGSPTRCARASPARAEPATDIGTRWRRASSTRRRRAPRGRSGGSAAAAGAPDRLLAELACCGCWYAAYRRLDEIPPALAATIRGRIGFTVATEEVLASRGCAMSGP